MNRFAKMLLPTFLTAFLFGCSLPTPIVRSAGPGHDFLIQTPQYPGTVWVWSQTHSVRLWIFHTKTTEPFVLDYGHAPPKSNQVLPRDGKPPAPLPEGERIVVHVAIMRPFMHPGSRVVAFEKRGDSFVPVSGDEFDPPLWDSFEEREKFLQAYNRDISDDNPHRPDFLRIAADPHADPAQRETVRVMMLAIGEQEPKKAWFKLRLYDRLTLGPFGDGKLYDLTPLVDLTHLKYLEIRGEAVLDLHPLANLKNLEYLGLRGTHVQDLGPLSGLSELRTLDISENQVSDLAPLAKLPGLWHLSASANRIRDLTPLGTIKQLNELDVSYNRILDLKPLVRLPDLRELNIRGNQIEDVSPLVDLVNRQSGNVLREVDVRDNPIRDYSPLARLKKGGVRVVSIHPVENYR